MSGPAYHFHVGVHDIYPTLISEVADAQAEVFAASKVHIVSDKRSRDSIRKALQGEASEFQHICDLALPINAARVIISAHGILCGKKHVVTEAGLYARTTNFCDGMRKFFSGCDVTLHLITPPQHDYPEVVEAFDRIGLGASWIFLVDELLEKVPGVRLVVWPVEDPVSDSVEFMEGVTGVKFPRPGQALIRRAARGQRRLEPPQLDPGSTLSRSLDELFHRDMDELIREKGVSVGIGRIRNEFSVS